MFHHLALIYLPVFAFTLIKLVIFKNIVLDDRDHLVPRYFSSKIVRFVSFGKGFRLFVFLKQFERFSNTTKEGFDLLLEANRFGRLLFHLYLSNFSLSCLLLLLLSCYFSLLILKV